MLQLDKLAAFICGNEEMFDSIRIVISTWNSEEEYQRNPYLGFYRYRVVKKYFKVKFCINENYFIFKDISYIYDGMYRKVSHLGTSSGVSYFATTCIP